VVHVFSSGCQQLCWTNWVGIAVMLFYYVALILASLTECLYCFPHSPVNETAQFKVTLRRQIYIPFTLLNSWCWEMFHNTLYEIFMVFCIILLLYILYIIPCPTVILQTFGSMECTVCMNEWMCVCVHACKS
jgi:hypothetical protein